MRFSAAPRGRRRGIVVLRLPLHKGRAALPLRCRTLAGGVVAPQYCVRDQGGALIEYRPSLAAPGRAAHTRSAPMRVNDPRGFDFGLGETADMLRDSVSGFAAERIFP